MIVVVVECVCVEWGISVMCSVQNCARGIDLIQKRV